MYGELVKRVATLFLQVGYEAFYRVFRDAYYIPIALYTGDSSLLDWRVVDPLIIFQRTTISCGGITLVVGFDRLI